MTNRDIISTHTGDISFLLQGIEYIHKSGINYHGELNSRNILIDNHWVLKLSKFGLKTLREKDEVRRLGGNKLNCKYKKSINSIRSLTSTVVPSCFSVCMLKWVMLPKMKVLDFLLKGFERFVPENDSVALHRTLKVYNRKRLRPITCPKLIKFMTN